MKRASLGPRPSTPGPENPVCYSRTSRSWASRSSGCLLPKPDGQRLTWGDPKRPFFTSPVSIGKCLGWLGDGWEGPQNMGLRA